METKFKVGQEVWFMTANFKIFKSKIKEIYLSKKYPIELEIGHSFTKEGKGNINDAIPVLSTTPFEIELKGFSQEPQEVLPPKDTLVWVRETDKHCWNARFFSHKKDEKYYCFDRQLKSHETDVAYGYMQMSIECPLK